jgi:CzcA family heavy metal efflux pump
VDQAEGGATHDEDRSGDGEAEEAEPMIRAIVRSSLRFRLLILALAAGVMVAGVVQLRDAPVDVLPEFTPPYAEIQTEALGLSADEVEQLITVPLEADLLNGVEGVEVIRSESLPGLSSIVLVFEQGTDIYRARQLVEERLTQAHALPHVSEAPTLLQPLSSSSRVLMIGLSSDSLSPTEQSLIARWTMRPRLMGVPGVANVAIWGQRDEQLQVQVDPEQLRDRNVTLSQVIRTAGNAQVVSPLSFLEGSTPGTGGFIETPQQRLQVRNVFDKIADPKELGKVPVEGAQGRMRLSDVSKIRVGHQPLIGDAVVGDGAGLVLVVEKFPGASTPEVTDGVEEALDDLEPALSGLRTDTSTFRPASLIEDAIDNLTLTIAIAAALLVLVLAALLFQWRTVAIALATIPVSLAAAALVIDLLGETFNAISFAGLAAAVAIVIDEAVVSAENVGRRLRRRGRGASGASRPMASRVLDATHEMRAPLAYGSLIALLAIAPVAVMEGRPGAFFEPMALSYALAVGAAMLVALTVAPALSVTLFSKRTVARDSALLRGLAPRYGAALRSFMARPRAVLIVVGVAAVVGLATVPFLDTSAVPAFKDRDVLVRLDAPPGTSNPRMTRIATDLGRELRALPGVDEVGAHVGRAKTGDQLVNVDSGELWVSLAPGADHDRTLASIEAAVDRTRGVEHDVTTYTAERIRDVGALREGDNPASGNDIDVLTGSDKPLVVRMYGQDLATLRGEARRALRAVSRVDGVVDPTLELPVTQPTIEIETDLDRAQRFGVKPGDVRRAEAALIQGIHVGSIFKEQKVFDVIVRGVPATRRSVASVRNLLLDRPGGGHVRLGQVADVRVGKTPVSIERDAVSRRLDIEAGVSGRSLDAVAGDVEDRLSRMRFPLEYHAEVIKRTAADEIGATRMIVVAIAAALACFLLLQAAFRSWTVAALVFLTLPLALVGGLVLALVSGGALSLGSLLGLVAVLALAARTGLVLIRHMQDLAPDSGRFGPGLVERGALERLAPILTSAAGIAAVMLPFVIAGSPPGLEVIHPMAIVVLGGLVTSTLLSLFVLPALYLRFGGRQPTLSPEEELMQRWADVAPEEEPVERAPLA